MRIKIDELKCLRCGHEWIPRQKEIRICPRCKSTLWDKPKQRHRILNKLEEQHAKARKGWLVSRNSEMPSESKSLKRMTTLEERRHKLQTRHLKKRKS